MCYTFNLGVLMLLLYRKNEQSQLKCLGWTDVVLKLKFGSLQKTVTI